MAGNCSTFNISALRRDTNGCGVRAGSSTPNHGLTSYPGTPDSAIVGTSGKAAVRLRLVTPIGRRRPAFICVITDGMPVKVSCTWPLMVSVIAGVLPLYGTWVMRTSAIVLKSSAARCGALPLPPEP